MTFLFFVVTQKTVASQLNTVAAFASGALIAVIRKRFLSLLIRDSVCS